VSRRRLAVAIGIVALLLALLAGLRVALQPARVTGLLLSTLGESLGLEIVATGIGEYRLRGTPTLVVRDLVARQPGAATPLLQAERVEVAVPWSTVRSRGAVLDIIAIELDAPRLDLQALQAWLATRPESEAPLPTLRDGLRIRDGVLVGDGWTLAELDADIAEFRENARLRARLGGRFLAPPTSLAFAAALSVTRPGNGAGVGLVGSAAFDREDLHVPARFILSGPLQLDDGDVRVVPLRAGVSAAVDAGGEPTAVAMGVHGALTREDGAWFLQRAGVAVRGGGPVPSLDAAGSVAYGDVLGLHLQGALARWPDAWPALPPSLDDAALPTQFALDYSGGIALEDPVRLRLRRDGATVDARFRAMDVLAWTQADSDDTPLPPLQGSASIPSLEISGALLEGVEIEFEDPAQATP
jgi:hypothetical protein